MKPFRSILNEAAGKARVVLFGRMNPPTSGHEENVLAAHKVAQQHNADLHVVASHSHDAKKNPLSGEQKSTHLNRAFGHLKHTTITSSSKEAPTVLHQAAAAHAAGVKHFILAGGGDRAASMHKLLHQYNGVKSAHGYYHFDKISVANTGERKAGVSGTDMRKHAAAGNYAEFKKHLPSNIRSHEHHAQDLYNDVRHGMGVHKEESDRELYVAGVAYKLGDIVEDTFTGLEGKIVYRGPTYVTVQIDETTSFKRWVEDVDLKTPVDIYTHHLNRIKFCPLAVKAFAKLVGNSDYDQSLVLTALDKTAHYLDIEEHANPDVPDTLNDHAVAEFVRNMRAAAQLLDKLGVLPEHESYMEKHAHDLMNIMHGNAPGPKEESMQNFKNFVVAEANTPNEEHFTEADLKAIEQHIDKIEWEDIRHLYGEQKHEEMEEEVQLEALSAAERMKKKMQFMKTKAKREIAREIALKRISSQSQLKKKAITHARHLMMNRLLRGRDKTRLSAAEKDRIEKIVHNARAAVIRISNKLMPKLRQLEQKRIKHMHEGADLSNANVHPTPNTDYNQDTAPADIHPGVAQAVRKLSGETEKPVDPRLQVDSKKVMRKIKNFRKMEV